MAKYINKTQPTTIIPEDFIRSTANPKLVDDCLELLKIFTQVTEKNPVVWGKIIGYGKYHYISKACEADWFVTGFAPRANEITIYCLGGYELMSELIEQLGKFKTKGSCLYVKKLSDIDLKILEKIIYKNQEYMEKNFKVDK